MAMERANRAAGCENLQRPTTPAILAGVQARRRIDRRLPGERSAGVKGGRFARSENFPSLSALPISGRGGAFAPVPNPIAAPEAGRPAPRRRSRPWSEKSFRPQHLLTWSPWFGSRHPAESNFLAPSSSPIPRRNQWNLARINHTFLKKFLVHRADRGPNRGHGVKHLVRSVSSVGWAPCPLCQEFGERACEISGLTGDFRSLRFMWKFFLCPLLHRTRA